MFASSWSWFLEFCAAQYGNIARVVGLVVTLFTLWKVSQVRKAAQQAARAAVAQVSAALLRGDVSDCLRLLREARDAARTRQWARAIDRSEEVRLRLADLHRQGALTEEEKTGLGTAVDDLGLIVRYMEGLASRVRNGMTCRKARGYSLTV